VFERVRVLANEEVTSDGRSEAEELRLRVQEVCRARRPGVALRDLHARPPRFMATWNDDGVVRQQLIEVCQGTPDDDTVGSLVAQVHAVGTDTEAEIVYEGPPPERALRDQARRRGIRVRSFQEFQGLLDLRDYLGEQSRRIAADSRYDTRLYLPQRFREAERTDGPVREDLVDHLLDVLAAPDGRFVLLLGEFGYGKSFALHELARRVPERLPHITPVFIPLHSLDKSHSLEGLVAAHLAGHGVDTIDLRALRYALARGQLALIFDGFDELVNRISFDRAADHLSLLLNAAVDDAKIIVSSRTQHFKSADQVYTALGERIGMLPRRRILALESFAPGQVRSYLDHYYGDEERAAERHRLLQNIPSLMEMCANPRLLSFVAGLHVGQLRAVAGAGRALSPARLYEEVFTSWLRFEEQRGQGNPGAPRGLPLDQLWEAVTVLAVQLWESGRNALGLDELTAPAGPPPPPPPRPPPPPPPPPPPLPAAEAAHAVGAGSLLVRTEDEEFGFIHSSVKEWLVARAAARDLLAGDYRIFARRPFGQLTVEFLCDIADRVALAAWAEGATHADPGATHVNALKVLGRLRVPTSTDLRGAQLAREDLSARDFTGVDLTGADLTEAHLGRAGFAGAILRRARLVGARLDHADLTGADLTDADLSRVRLIGTDLRGTQLAGSTWNRAALVAPVLDAGAREDPALRRAVLAPPLRAEPAFRPTVVGVPYGYGLRAARLPEPVSFSPDGELVAIGTDTGAVVICDASGLALRTLDGHAGRVYSVHFRRDVLATSSADGTVQLWDPVTGRRRKRLVIQPDGVWPMALDHAGDQLVAGEHDGTLTLWDPAEGTPRHRLAGHDRLVYATSFSPDGSLLATGCAGGQVLVWSTVTGELLHSLPGHEGTSVFRVRFSPDGTRLATVGGERDGQSPIQVWDMPGARLRHRLTGHTAAVYTLHFHPGSRMLASGDTAGRVRVWDTDEGTGTADLDGCAGAVYRVTYDSEGRLLAACDSAGTIRLWRAGPTPGHAVTPLPQQPAGQRGITWTCAFRPARDGERSALVSVGSDDGVWFWDPATGQGRRARRGHGRRVTGVAFRPAGTALAAASNDGVVRLWNPTTGSQGRVLAGHGDLLVSALFNPAEPVLATASNDGDIYLWNADSGEHQRELDAETEQVWAEAFSPDGSLLATANDDDTVRLWYRATGAHRGTLTQHRGRVRAIAFRHDGAELATGCDDRRIRLWEPESSRLIAELTGHHDRVYAVGYAPDGSWLVSASWDGTGAVWQDGTVRHWLRGHSGRLWAAAVHPLRPLAVTAGDDRTVRLWNTENGSLAELLTGHTGRILSVAFSPDGETLASAGEDGTVRLWNVPASRPATLRATLIGTATGWAAVTPSGGYKTGGDVNGEFWHVVGMCRFIPGELDPYLTGVQRLPLDAPLTPPR
jgi:WD40 repeat protein